MSNFASHRQHVSELASHYHDINQSHVQCQKHCLEILEKVDKWQYIYIMHIEKWLLLQVVIHVVNPVISDIMNKIEHVPKKDGNHKSGSNNQYMARTRFFSQTCGSHGVLL